MYKVDGIVVVEGRDDKTALKRVIDANIYILNGMSGINKKKIDDLKKLSEKNKIYLLTDPDHAGNKIRNILNQNIPDIINLYANKTDCDKNKDIGVENLSDEKIIEIFENIRYKREERQDIFNFSDILDNKLTNNENASIRRRLLCEILSIGNLNSKQLLKNLNTLNITREEFEKAMNTVEKMQDKVDKTAAIFGKFFPIHKGHVNFIKTVSKYCKHLYVFVCEETKRDEILNEKSNLPKKLTIYDRIDFVKKELKGYKNITIVHLNEDGINPYPNGWKAWSERVLSLNIDFDIVFTNEVQDVENYKKYMGKDAYLIDFNRSEFNISSTKIRENPEKYMEYIPNSVMEYLYEK